jgi:hypothetical protein
VDDLEKRVKILEDDNLALRRRMNLKDAISELISKQDELVQTAKDMMAYDEELAKSPDIKNSKLWHSIDMCKEGEKSAPAQCELCLSIGPPVGMNFPECGSSKDYGDILPLDKNVTNTTVGYFKELFNSPNLKDSTPVTFSLFHSVQELDTALEYQMSGGGDSGICIQLSEVEVEEDSQKPK